MPAIILNHSRHEVKLRDPRDPEVMDVLADAYDGLPVLGHSEPIHVRALRGSLPAETCAGCGQPNAYHLDTAGLYWVGCQGVPARHALKALVSRPLSDVQEWGDAHPTVSSALRDALLVGCGQDVAAFFNGLSADERLHLSRRLASIAAVALRAEDAKWNR